MLTLGSSGNLFKSHILLQQSYTSHSHTTPFKGKVSVLAHMERVLFPRSLTNTFSHLSLIMKGNDVVCKTNDILM